MLIVGALPALGSVTLSENASTTVVDHHSVGCDAAIGTDDNTYYRSFTFSNFGIGEDFRVSEVDFGVEEASSGANSQSLTLTIYSGTSVAPVGPVLATDTFDISDQTLSTEAHPIDALVPFSSGGLVVGLFSPAAGNTFLIGTNSAGESAPGYIEAPACGFDQPTPLSGVSSDVDVVMTVTGDVVPEPRSSVLVVGAVATLLGLGALRRGAAQPSPPWPFATAGAIAQCHPERQRGAEAAPGRVSPWQQPHGPG
jgi:hypothetical protein